MKLQKKFAIASAETVENIFIKNIITKQYLNVNSF